MTHPEIFAITFDVFGTLLEFPEECRWARRYAEEVREANAGRRPYRRLDAIFAEIGADWKELRPRDGVLDAVGRLGRHYTVAAMSNANSDLCWEISAHFGLRWNAWIRTEDAGAFKPDPRFYCNGLRQLEADGHQVLHVAAHKFDLRGARAMGLRTAFIDWPGYTDEAAEPGEFDFRAETLSALADGLT